MTAFQHEFCTEVADTLRGFDVQRPIVAMATLELFQQRCNPFFQFFGVALVRKENLQNTPGSVAEGNLPVHLRMLSFRSLQATPSRGADVTTACVSCPCVIHRGVNHR